MLRSTGWLTHWGEIMANTSAAQMAAGLDGILKYNNGSGSLNFYMAHGGTNFGFWAGAAVAVRRATLKADAIAHEEQSWLRGPLHAVLQETHQFQAP